MGRYLNDSKARRIVPVGNGVVTIGPGQEAELPDAAAAGLGLVPVLRVEPIALPVEPAKVDVVPVTEPASVAAEPAQEPAPVADVEPPSEPVAPKPSRSERKRLAREAKQS